MQPRAILRTLPAAVRLGASRPDDGGMARTGEGLGEVYREVAGATRLSDPRRLDSAAGSVRRCARAAACARGGVDPRNGCRTPPASGIGAAVTCSNRAAENLSRQRLSGVYPEVGDSIEDGAL
jgi:hypothetical protein